MLTCRSPRRVRPPDAAVNASTNLGSQAITSRITSGRSTGGSMAFTCALQDAQPGRTAAAYRVSALIDAGGGDEGKPAVVGDCYRPARRID